jgi:tetratricopeptide (TPR) repeat protein
VFLLINGGSGSASEPLAYFLKTTGRATLVGEPTPGAILAAVPHPVGQGWVLTLPEADYYAADGVRLEGHGVTPHMSVPWIDAFIAVADSLRPRYPYAAALLAAQGALSNVTAENRERRLPVAERWAREALRLAPDSAAPVNALSAALASQRHWAIGFAVWDSLLAIAPERLVVRYQIGRFAALSGEQLERGEQSLRAYLAASRPRNGPTHAVAHWYLGMLLEKQGDRSAARREYESGLALEPGNVDLKASLARLASSPTP